MWHRGRENGDGLLMACSHCMGPGTGNNGVYITLCTVHTAQGQGQGTIVFHCVHSGPCPITFPVPCSVYKP